MEVTIAQPVSWRLSMVALIRARLLFLRHDVVLSARAWNICPEVAISNFDLWNFAFHHPATHLETHDSVSPSASEDWQNRF